MPKIRARPALPPQGSTRMRGAGQSGPPLGECSAHVSTWHFHSLTTGTRNPLQALAPNDLHSHSSHCCFSGPNAFHMAANPSFSLAEAEGL